MGAMDHRNSDGRCIWDHETWPCKAAQVRHELAEYLRNLPLTNTGDYAYDVGRDAGIERAADAIDTEL